MSFVGRVTHRAPQARTGGTNSSKSNTPFQQSDSHPPLRATCRNLVACRRVRIRIEAEDCVDPIRWNSLVANWPPPCHVTIQRVPVRGIHRTVVNWESMVEILYGLLGSESSQVPLSPFSQYVLHLSGCLPSDGCGANCGKMEKGEMERSRPNLVSSDI